MAEAPSTAASVDVTDAPAAPPSALDRRIEAAFDAILPLVDKHVPALSDHVRAAKVITLNNKKSVAGKGNPLFHYLPWKIISP